MAKTLFNRSSVEAKQPPSSRLSVTGSVSLNYNYLQPSLYFWTDTETTVVVQPPTIKVTAPTLLSGDSYLDGQMWLQPAMSRGIGLKIYSNGQWVNVLSDGLAGYTSGLTPNRPIGAQVSILGWGTQDPPADSSQLNAFGYNSYTCGKQLPNTIAIGSGIGRYLTNIQGSNRFIGADNGGIESLKGGLTTVKDSTFVGYGNCSWVKAATVTSSIYLGSNIPYAEPYRPEWYPPLDSLSSTSDIFISTNEVYTGGQDPDQRRQFDFITSDKKSYTNAKRLASIVSGNNILIGNSFQFLAPMGDETQTFTGTISDCVLISRSVNTLPVTLSGAVSLGTNYDAAGTRSVSIKGATAILSDSIIFPGAPISDSIAIGASYGAGVKANVQDSKNIAILFGNFARDYSWKYTSGGTPGGIFLGDYNKEDDGSVLFTNPIIFAAGGRLRWTINNGAWSFDDEMTRNEPFKPKYGFAGWGLKSNGPDKAPEWDIMVRGATGSFQLDSGETVYVENGLITSIS
jgi:hypothetical protein